LILEGTISTFELILDYGLPIAEIGIGYPGSELDLTLITPGGIVIDPAYASSNPNVDFRYYTNRTDNLGNTYDEKYYIMSNPEAGTWTIRVTAVDTPAEGERFSVGAVLKGDGTQSQPLYGDISGNGNVSAYDASLAAQYAVGLIELTPEQITAADGSGNGTVSAYDASLVAQYAVGLIDRFPVEGMQSQMIALSSVIASENPVTVTAGSGYGSPGDVDVEIPITVSNVAGLGIVSLDFELKYNASQLAFSSISIDGTIAQDLSYGFNEITPGTIRAAIYGAEPMAGQGILLRMYFDVRTEAVNGTMALVLRKAEFNEGVVTSSLENGSFLVTSDQLVCDFCGANFGPPDGYVDVWDLMQFSDYWHTRTGEGNWDSKYDLTGPNFGIADDYIDVWDLMVFADHWHEGERP